MTPLIISIVLWFAVVIWFIHTCKKNDNEVKKIMDQQHEETKTVFFNCIK